MKYVIFRGKKKINPSTGVNYLFFYHQIRVLMWVRNFRDLIDIIIVVFIYIPLTRLQLIKGLLFSYLILASISIQLILYCT